MYDIEDKINFAVFPGKRTTVSATRIARGRGARENEPGMKEGGSA